MIEALLMGGLSLLGGGLGAYFGAYLKKKGENRAIHDDISNLVDQVRAVTQTTKEIEAKISTDVWNEQKRWEMKREVLFGAAKSILAVDDGLVSLDTLLRMDDPDGDQWAEARLKATRAWREALRQFDETKILTGIVCSKETVFLFEELGIFASNLGAKLAEKDKDIYRASSQALGLHLARARFAIRKELGIDIATAASVSK